MNPKERYYSGVARETIHRITANRENWTSFLATMARNYDFTYPEQVMIYAQRPNATLCKPYEEWNTELCEKGFHWYCPFCDEPG